ncbi:MAG: outer membrane protein transport protein [Rhodospirillales bacterium]|nr:outer membrane protein transport protein [Rhodospirillales bacterium]
MRPFPAYAVVPPDVRAADRERRLFRWLHPRLPPRVHDALARALLILAALAASLIALVEASPARAGGFQLRTGSPDWSANAFAGMSAKAYDASTAWTNPAGMTRISGNEVDLGINAVWTSITFAGTDTIGGAPVTGSQGGNAGGLSALPALEAVFSVTPDLKLGLSVEEPFGLRTSWSGDFVGRYQALVSSISDVEIGLVGAYRLTPTLSIGGGPIIDHLAARLTTAINTGPLAAFGDPVADVGGDSWAVGYHLGLLWEATPALRFGLDYRSRIGEAISGNQTVTIPAMTGIVSPATAAALGTLAHPVQAQLALPDVLTLGGAWEITPRITALATLQWVHWSLLQALTLTNGASPSAVMVFHNRDAWMGSLGVNYTPAGAPRWRLQGGIGYERGPIEPGSRTPRLPGQDVIMLGVGASYAITPAIRVQAAYLHEFGLADGSNSYSATPSAGVLTGAYSVAADVASLGVAWRF